MSDPKTTSLTNGEARTILAQSTVVLPRITIKFCTQCKWNLRAAYYAQELLQTFSTTLGEVALVPSSGGVFEITLFTASAASPTSASVSASPSASQSTSTTLLTSTPTNPAEQQDSSSTQSNPSAVPINPSPNKDIKVLETTIWNRKTDTGFPETKELKSRVRNIIEPGRDLGHVDRSLREAKGKAKGSVDEVGKRTGGDVVGEKGVEGEDGTHQEECKDC